MQQAQRVLLDELEALAQVLLARLCLSKGLVQRSQHVIEYDRTLPANAVAEAEQIARERRPRTVHARSWRPALQ